jgi:hypothetical protein
LRRRDSHNKIKKSTLINYRSIIRTLVRIWIAQIRRVGDIEFLFIPTDRRIYRFLLEPGGSTFFGTEPYPKYFNFSDPESKPEPLEPKSFLRTTKVIYILSFLDHFSTNKFCIYSWYRMMMGNVKKKVNNLVVCTYRERQQQFNFFL